MPIGQSADIAVVCPTTAIAEPRVSPVEAPKDEPVITVEETPEVEPEVPLGEMLKDELKELCADQGLPVSGTKLALIERLGG